MSSRAGGDMMGRPEIKVVTVKAVERLTPAQVERYNREREALTEIQRSIIDAHDEAFFRAALFARRKQ